MQKERTTTKFTANDNTFHCRIDGPEGAPRLISGNSLATDPGMRDGQVAVFGLGTGPAGRVNERPAFQQILRLLTDLPARLITAASAGNVPCIFPKCVEVISPIRPPRNPVVWCIPGRGVNISS